MAELLEYFSCLYKADQRQIYDNDAYHLFATLNPCEQKNTNPVFENLCFINDIYLSPGKEFVFENEKYRQQVILPLAGMPAYSNAVLENKIISNEELLLVNDSYKNSIRNIYEAKALNFLQIGFKKNKTNSYISLTHPLNFNAYNRLVPLPCNISIGIYNGRQKGQYILNNPGSGLFIYIINGAFEAEDRLLEHRDGLALWNTGKIEFEALSEFSIILLIELQIKIKNE